MIRTSCDGGWEFNFDLFGGNSETDNTVKIYNYFLRAQDSHSSNLYLNVSTVPNEYKPFKPNPIYIPGEEIAFTLDCCTMYSNITVLQLNRIRMI